MTKKRYGKINKNPQKIELTQPNLDYWELHLEVDHRRPSAINQIQRVKDRQILRRAQLALAEKGELGHLVRHKYVAELIGEHPHYIMFVLKRLVENGEIGRYYRYFRDKSDSARQRRRRFYYDLGGGV